MRTDGRWVFLLVLVIAGAFASQVGDCTGASRRAPIATRTAPAIMVSSPSSISFRAAHRQRHRFGFIDARGRFVIAPRFADARAFSEGRAAVCVPQAPAAGSAGCRWGFVDPAGALVIAATWDDALSFSDGRAPVCRRAPGQGCRWGLVDLQGRTVAQPRYDRLRELSGGLAAFSEGGLWGFVDRDGRESIPARFRMASDFADGLAAVLVGGLWGFADRSGALVVPATWNQARGFADGLAWVQRGNQARCLAPDGTLLPQDPGPPGRADPGAPVPTRQGSRWGFVDRSGVPVIPATFLEARDFSEGLAAVRLGEPAPGAWGYVDARGLLVGEARFERAGPHRHGFAVVERHGGSALVDRRGRLWNGPRPELGDGACALAAPLQAVTAASRPALADPFGTVVVTPRDGRARTAVEGLAIVEEGGRQGWVDGRGAWLVRPRFRRVDDFHEGLAPVAEQSVFGYARPSGELAIPARFRLAGAFSGGLAWVGMTPAEADRELALR